MRDHGLQIFGFSAGEARFDGDDLSLFHPLDRLDPHRFQESERRVQNLLFARKQTEPARSACDWREINMGMNA